MLINKQSWFVKNCKIVLFSILMFYVYLRSLPSRERGLKLCDYFITFFMICRRSLRGSVDWNINIHIYIILMPCRSLRGSVDWNFYRLVLICRQSGRSLRGSVDWNVRLGTLPVPNNRRSLRGSVDWNTLWLRLYRYHRGVAPFAGAWIEITPINVQLLIVIRRSLRGSVDWNSVNVASEVSITIVAPFAGAWIEIYKNCCWKTHHHVAPFAGAWIEI